MELNSKKNVLEKIQNSINLKGKKNQNSTPHYFQKYASKFNFKKYTKKKSKKTCSFKFLKVNKNNN